MKIPMMHEKAEAEDDLVTNNETYQTTILVKYRQKR